MVNIYPDIINETRNSLAIYNNMTFELRIAEYTIDQLIAVLGVVSFMDDDNLYTVQIVDYNNPAIVLLNDQQVWEWYFHHDDDLYENFLDNILDLD